LDFNAGERPKFKPFGTGRGLRLEKKMQTAALWNQRPLPGQFRPVKVLI
jgi:hypothetical protein